MPIQPRRVHLPYEMRVPRLPDAAGSIFTRSSASQTPRGESGLASASACTTIMAKSRDLGMQTFDQSLFELYEADKITYEDALRNADSVNELRLRVKLEGKDAKRRDIMSGLDHLNIV